MESCQKSAPQYKIGLLLLSRYNLAQSSAQVLENKIKIGSKTISLLIIIQDLKAFKM